MTVTKLRGRSLQALVWKYRGKLMVPPLLLALFCTKWEMENHLIVFGLGGLLLVTGVALRIWAQMHLHFRLKKQLALTTCGPYAYVRNPFYIANTMIVVGLTTMSEVVVLVPLVLAWCALVYTHVVRYEEADLAQRYGEPYLRYCQHVRRWWPRLTPFPAHTQPAALSYLGPSLAVESLSLLLSSPFIIKELIH